MSNPTSNFGWQMPTNTDLVSALPADFEVFGQAVDTSLADLKGGTTGQVLKKNTNTDMDFVWAADSAGMTNPMTTTGDTIYSSSGSTPARLGIGTTGQVLTVSGGVPTWATSASGSLTLLSTTTLTGTSVTVSSISGSYQNLFIRIDNLGTGGAAGVCRMTVNSVTSYLAVGVDSGTTAVFSNGGNIPLTGNRNMKDTGGDYKAAVINIYNYAATNTYKAFDVVSGCTGSGGGDAVTTAGGNVFSTAAITSVTVSMSAGSFDGNPSMKIYGVN
jgi:hypothetical protein